MKAMFQLLNMNFSLQLIKCFVISKKAKLFTVKMEHINSLIKMCCYSNLHAHLYVTITLHLNTNLLCLNMK